MPDGVDVADAAVVLRTADGRLELRQSRQLAVGDGVVGGGTLGLVAGMLVGGPVAIAIVGMAAGGAWGARDTGLDDARLRELGVELGPGAAVVCALVATADAVAVRRAFASYGKLVE